MKIVARVITVMVLLLSSAFYAAAQPEVLFTPKGYEADRSFHNRKGVVRARSVDVSLPVLPGLPAERRSADLKQHELLLNLFDDVVLPARLHRVEREADGLAWVGKLDGFPAGDVVIVARDGVVAGSITSPEAAYSIRYDGYSHVVEEVDRSALPDADDNFIDLQPPQLEETTDPQATVDDGSTIDVLVVYTPAARVSAGGTSAIQSRIQLGVAESNAGYANSGVIQRLRLVGAIEVSYSESGDIVTDLNRVTAPSDGFLDTVPTLRNNYKADLVSLVTATPNTQYCGVAWLMSGNNPGFAPYAYSVVEEVCISPNYTFAHELGHNMGLNHARTDPVGDGAYSYSYGYKDPNNAFRTIMAYDCPGGCPRILNFSNPNVTYAGKPTGVSETAVNSANNALSLNNTRVTVANWRVGATPRVTVTYPNGGESLPAGSQQVIAWTASDLSSSSTTKVYYTDASGTDLSLVAEVSPTTTSCVWTVPHTPGATGRIRVCSSNGSTCEAQDLSDSQFLVTSAVTAGAMNDLNGDTIADILWHHQGSGSLVAWFMNGLTIAGDSFLAPAQVSDTGWQVRGIVDLNRDGNSDLLWYHEPSGSLYAWLMNGVQAIVGTSLWPPLVSDKLWKIAAVADFDKDGNNDFLWQHTGTGHLAVWHMDGLYLRGGSYLAPSQVPDTQWQIRAAGDFNGDGAVDILWQNATTGHLYVWLMNGVVAMSGVPLAPNQVADTQWQIRGARDFNGDGNTDILWYHKSAGYLYVWLMNGLTATVGLPLTPAQVPDTQWQIVVR
ncbi:MAG: hypothetical protein GX443_13220 [Deltaproteobacteria bacterium]|nr:hypothetical protein [Deltaproteobacteria bacterium]